MLRIKSSTLLLLIAIFAFSAPGQESHHSEVSLSLTGNLQAQATGLGVTDSASEAAGMLVSYRYRFNEWSAIEINYNDSRFTQYYTPAVTHTQANADEFTMAYVNTLGRPVNARFAPFIELGTGALIFSPVSIGSSVGALRQGEPIFLFGTGVDWRALPHLSLRLGYRGLVYKAPDFLVGGQQTTNATTTMSEPYLGIVFRF